MGMFSILFYLTSSYTSTVTPVLAQFWSDRMCCRNTLSFISIVDLHFTPENDHYFTVFKTNRVKSPQNKRLDSSESVLFQSMVFCFFISFFVFVFFLVFENTLLL